MDLKEQIRTIKDYVLNQPGKSLEDFLGSLKYSDQVLADLLYDSQQKCRNLEEELTAYKLMARDWERQKLDYEKQLKRGVRLK